MSHKSPDAQWVFVVVDFLLAPLVLGRELARAARRAVSAPGFDKPHPKKRRWWR